MNSTTLWWILNSIFIVVFDVVFFLLINPISDVQWVGFAFLHVSYVLAVFFANYLRNKRTDVVLGYPVIYLSVVYFIASFILTLAVVIFEFASVKVTFVLYFILLGIYLFVLFSNLLMNKHTEEQMATERKNISFVKENIAILEQFKSTSVAKKYNKKIEEVIELLRYGQIISNPNTADLEYSIRQQIMGLVSTTSEEELLQKLTSIEGLIRQREIKIKSIVTN
ncbi:hypothetical protein [Bacillus timonensis]|uniref:hypothetical protein n=1 Tax=Bacillus timonensis TaxID=1033734 RepID=UPI000289383C|nr:hypothetical protein [Bacillus timonensis]